MKKGDGEAGHGPEIKRAAESFAVGDLQSAEATLRGILAQRPHELAAVHMLAEVALQTGHVADGEKLLRYALTLSPGFDQARLTCPSTRRYRTVGRGH